MRNLLTVNSELENMRRRMTTLRAQISEKSLATRTSDQSRSNGSYDQVTTPTITPIYIEQAKSNVHTTRSLAELQKLRDLSRQHLLLTSMKKMRSGLYIAETPMRKNPLCARKELSTLKKWRQSSAQDLPYPSMANSSKRLKFCSTKSFTTP